MRRGLVAVIPERALRLLTWREVENMACGDPVIDLQLLKSHTSYVGAWDKDHEAVGHAAAVCLLFRKAHPPPLSLQVQRFWRVLEGFSQEDRSKFIRYCWGRSRLPKPSSWPPNTPFKLTKHNGGDDILPPAHTWCVCACCLPTCSRWLMNGAACVVCVSVCLWCVLQLLPNRVALLLNR